MTETAVGVTETAAAPTATDGIGPDTFLRIRVLTVVPQGEDFLVGDPSSGTFAVLPRIGVSVIELLRSGRCLREVAAAAEEQLGTQVDVVDFARSLCEMNLAEVTEAAEAAASPAVAAAAGPSQAQAPAMDRPPRPRWGPLVSGPTAWIPAILAAIGTVAMFAARPALLPSVNDAFFLSTPVRSMAALTVLSFALRGLHEGCHWLAARAEGVPATVSVDRRLYILVFETDLTGLWALRRRSRYWPLLIGIGFDTFVLAGLLAARSAAHLDWWQPAPQLGKLLAALAFLQTTSIVLQFFIFLRTDVYAVVLTATGCFNLWRATRLLLRQRLGLARPAHRAELAAAHPRDLAVARWYVWPYGAGMLLAVWYFVVYFCPATLRVLRWIGATLLHTAPDHAAFWEAAGYGLLLLAPQILTLRVAARDLLRRNANKNSRNTGATS